VHRKLNAPPLTGIKKLFAVVTDEPLILLSASSGLDDVQGIAD